MPLKPRVIVVLTRRVYISSHVRFHENTFPYPKLKNLAPNGLSQPIFDISDILKLTSTTQQLSSVPASETALSW